MNPRPQTAGTAGIVAGVLLAVLFISFMTSGAAPDTMTDPAKAMAFAGGNLSRWRFDGIVGTLAIVGVIFYFPGLAARLRDRTPSRATGVLYFSLVGVGAYGLNSVLMWVGDPAIIRGPDPVAAGHAWVALSAVHMGLQAFGSLAVGLAFLLAGWAAMTSKAFTSGVAWVGVVGGAAGILSVFSPTTEVFFLVSFALSVVFLIWSGLELRKAR